MDCRLCGATGLRHMYDVAGFGVGECTSCSLRQLTEHVADEIPGELYGADYFERGKYRNDFAGCREQRRRVRLLRSSGLGLGSKVLDYGTATGEFFGVASEFYEVWGVDIANEAIETAKGIYPGYAERFMTVGGLAKCGHRSFDAVVLWDVVEHLPNPLKTVGDLMQLLRPGGILAMSTPDAGSLLARLMGAHWHFITPPEHISLFSKRTLMRLFSAVGVEPQRHSRRGKWVNSHFFLGKAGRSFSGIISKPLVDSLTGLVSDKVSLYIPTRDIQYLWGTKKTPFDE